MTEDDARAWLDARVPRETSARLAHYADLLLDEADRQNLISSATRAQMWARHIVDSAQLIDHAPPAGRWIDLGSGAGLPGIVVGILGRHRVTLAESRTKRVAFLQHCIAELGLDATVDVLAGRVELIEAEPFDVISARAFAPLDRLFATAHHLGNAATRWILPKGRSTASELEVARRSWQGDVSTVASVTDPEASIIVAENVHPRVATRNSRSSR